MSVLIIVPHLSIEYLLSYSIKVRNLSEGTNIQALAWQIVSRCELIAPNRVPELEQILAYLQNRKDNKGGIEGILNVSVFMYIHV